MEPEMSKNEQNEVLAEAVRIEIDDVSGDVFIVFKAKNEKFKREIKENWIKDIEFKIINKKLFQK